MNFLKLFLAISLFVLTACKTSPKSADGTSSSGSSSTSIPGAIENPNRREIPTVTLVLGPGGAKALAHAGVIKALQESRIPVSRVIGIEWGSLAGAAFAAHGQYHEVEWKLYKLDQIDLSSKGGFFGFSRDRTIKVMNAYLRDNFGNINLANMKIPFSCPGRSFATGAMVWMRMGTAADGLRKCLPFPTLFQLQGNWLAAPTHAREVVQTLKSEGKGLIVFVDVLGAGSPFPKDKAPDASSVLLWQDMQRSVAEAQALAGEVIRVGTDGISMDRFDRRKELFQLGEQEGARAAQRLSSKYGF